MKNLPSFDELREMAEKDPKKLEALKREMVNEVIESADVSKQSRLKGLQFQIDAKIKTSRSPLESLSKVYNQMMDSFDELNELLSEFDIKAGDLQKDLNEVCGEEKEENHKFKIEIYKEKK